MNIKHSRMCFYSEMLLNWPGLLILPLEMLLNWPGLFILPLEMLLNWPGFLILPFEMLLNWPDLLTLALEMLLNWPGLLILALEMLLNWPGLLILPLSPPKGWTTSLSSLANLIWDFSPNLTSMCLSIFVCHWRITNFWCLIYSAVWVNCHEHLQCMGDQRSLKGNQAEDRSWPKNVENVSSCFFWWFCQ